MRVSSHPAYFSLPGLIQKIDEPFRSSCMRILTENAVLFSNTPAAIHNHQTWNGGYLDHLQEIMNLAIVLYDSLASLRPLPFSLSDALMVLFLHDIEKPWKYELDSKGALQIKESMRGHAAQEAFWRKMLPEYGVVFTPEQENAMVYVEGENAQYAPGRRTQGPLAAFCHLCDTTSARIWFEYPLAKQDPWIGADRNNPE